MSTSNRELREAFVQGALAQYSQISAEDVDKIKWEAKKCYQSKMVKRTKVVTVLDRQGRRVEMKVEDGTLWRRWPGGSWIPGSYDPHWYPLIAALVENPTELVGEEG